MNQEESNRLMNEQTARFRQEQRIVEDRQNEERQQNEDRARAERAAQEELRRREEDTRREEQRRQDDRRQQDDERRRSEQQKLETSHRQELSRKEQESEANKQAYSPDKNPRTMSEWKTEIEKERQKAQAQGTGQAQSIRGRGINQAPKPDQVESDYRYAMKTLKESNDAWGKHKSENAEGKSAVKQNESDSKESPAMEKYKAQEKTLSDKVQVRVDTQSQSLTHGRTR